MSIRSGVTSGTPSKIQFGAGVYFQGVEYSETVAPAEETIRAAIFGATQDGGTVTITPEFFAPELDGVHVSLRELQTKVGEKATMDTSIAELSADLIKHQVIGKVGETTDKEYDVITSAANLAAGHFYEGFGFYGEHLDGRPIIILFKQALCTSGFASDPKHKTNTVFKGTFECMGDIAYGTEKLPYAIFIRKAEGWVPVNSDEVAAA